MKRARDAADLLRRAAKGVKVGQKSAKRNTRLLYDAALLASALALAEASDRVA